MILRILVCISLIFYSVVDTSSCKILSIEKTKTCASVDSSCPCESDSSPFSFQESSQLPCDCSFMHKAEGNLSASKLAITGVFLRCFLFEIVTFESIQPTLTSYITKKRQAIPPLQIPLRI